MVVVYKWGGIAFDDKSLIKTLILPSDAKDDVPITFHDGASNYQVPGGKVFIPGLFSFMMDLDNWIARVGESDAVDGAITREVISAVSFVVRGAMGGSTIPVLGFFTAGKYVTAETDSTTQDLRQYSALYGIEIDA